MTGTPVISLRNVRRSFGKYFELGPLDVEIEPGHIVAVVGPNGGGKSTLIGMLMNLIQPDSGDIRLFGCAYPGDEVAIKQRIGYVPERFLGQDDMSANSLGEFYSYWYPKWDHRLYEERVERLTIDLDRKFGKLSKGVQRRLAFALALATGPDLLLLDEPIEGVDPIARGEMIEDVSRFLDEGGMRTVLFATNVMEVVRRVADYVVLLVDGEFLGLHEKDALRQEWTIFWVDREPQSDVPGVVEVESGRPTRIVSDSPHETAVALRAENIRIARRGALDLQEVLSHLMRRSREGSRA